MSRSDRECIECCLNGNPEAFGQLIGRYQAALLSYLLGRLGNRDAAGEAAQETFVRAYFGLKKLRKPESFFSWLLGIGGRVAKEQQRWWKRYRNVKSFEFVKAPDSASSNDYDLKPAIAKLPDLYREVILLRYYSDLSCAEVSEQLGIPLGTVTKRLSRAYAMLRESLRKE